MAMGIEVRIFTARVSHQRLPHREKWIRERIEKWCREHIGTTLKVTCIKGPGLLELWDDRARRVGYNTGMFE
jgi:hypothetical protein